MSESNLISVKGFIGFCGNDSFLADSFRNTFEKAICGSVFLSGDGYAVVASEDYVSACDGEIKLATYGKHRSAFTCFMSVLVEIRYKFLSISRDFWGTRTVYYYSSCSGLYFSSDIRFILSLPYSDNRDYDDEAISECATLGYIYKDSGTLFKNIKQLPRNSELIWQDGNIYIRNLKNISANPSRFSAIGDAFLCFKEALEQAVHDAAEISGRKAFFLSGGMDSSALALAASREFDQIETISFASENNQEDVYYAGELAKVINSRHSAVTFSEEKAILTLPAFLNGIENIEPEGIFNPMGGFAYYILCKEISDMGFDVVFPGEGADELLGGYYWQLTHTLGFIDKLREKTSGTEIHSRVMSLFPDTGDRKSHREAAYHFLQGSSLTNYHLSCIEHSAKAFGLYNCPVYMSEAIYDSLKDVPLDWLCDGETTKILLRKYLLPQLEPLGLASLVARRKLAMPSVITKSFMSKISYLAMKNINCTQNPYANVLRNNPVNIMMFDIFHKYYTLKPLSIVSSEEWSEDIKRLGKNEYIVHW